MRLIAVAVGVALLAACEGNLLEETACDRYADYVCDCHADDTGFDCAAFLDLAATADADTIDQCQLDFAALRDQDELDGLVCDV